MIPSELQEKLQEAERGWQESRKPHPGITLVELADRIGMGCPACEGERMQCKPRVSEFSPIACNAITGYWYLASPYSKYPEHLGGIHGAFHEVCRCAAWLLKQGVKTYSPIAHTHPIAMYGSIDPLAHDIWLPADLPLMQGACGLIVAKMPTWEISYGIGKEIEEFATAGKPVRYLDWPQVVRVAE